jgi:formate/nitrite transporter FocA (FNT family)
VSGLSQCNRADPSGSGARGIARESLGAMTDTSALFPGKHFISTVLDALETKTAMSGGLARVYLMRAAMAGGLIGVMYLAYFAVLAAFAGVGSGDLIGIGRLVGALVFGFALVFIYYSKSELLTSNMMIVSIGAYYRRTTPLKSLRILLLCYGGNIIGGLAVALLVAASTLGDGAVGEQMKAAVEHKEAYVSAGAWGWSDLFVRAILCNFMINLAMILVYNGLIKDDFTKSLAMIMSVFVFAFVGFEHSVANTVVFSIVGLQGGVDVGLALGNIGIVLLGNFVGGGLLIGYYYAYANDDRKFLGKQSPQP